MRARGFTLIEVLVALAVAGVALVAVQRGFGTGAAASARAASETAAVRSAEDALASALAGVPPAAAAPGRPAPVLRVTPRPDLIAAGAPRSVVPAEITVSVDWRDGGRIRTVRLSTLALAPPR
jgi:general secretion pathway protein I